MRLTVIPYFSLPGGALVRFLLILAMMTVCALVGKLLRRIPVLRHLV